MIKAVIFDMDGVLLDSEPFWRQAEIECFADVGIHLDEAKCLETQGIRIAEIVALYFRRSPWSGLSPEALTARIIERVAGQIRAKATKNAGVDEIVSFFQSKALPLGVATSSPDVHITAVMQALGLEGVFRVLYSADQESFGKPHPGVYLSTAKRLGVEPEQCLAIEDSVNGVIAAKAARMKCVAVPEALLQTDPRFSIADLRLTSLRGFGENEWAKLNRS